jgi:hypothetical protein
MLQLPLYAAFMAWTGVTLSLTKSENIANYLFYVNIRDLFDLSVDGRIILKWILKEEDGVTHGLDRSD